MALEDLTLLTRPAASGLASPRLQLSIKLLGLLLMFFSLAMLPPLAIEWYYQDGDTSPFTFTFGIILGLGFICWAPTYRTRGEPTNRDGFLVVVLFWVSLSLVGAIPFILAKSPLMGFTDAVFETVSGLTTTGATVLTGLDMLPHAILFYRAELHLLGGMGIVVLAVALLPMLGIGGMQLYRAETPGPMKDEKLTPRIAETAKQLWLVYVVANLLCILAFWLVGMSLFDAVAYAFATIATGGFSPHDASIGYYNSAAVEIVMGIFSFVGAMNFSLLFLIWQRGRIHLAHIWHDEEFRFFLLVYGLITVAVILTLYFHGKFALWPALYHGFAQSMSVLSDNGLVTAGYPDWPMFAVILLMFGSFFGGCAGSTGGGIKAIRFLLLYRQSARELKLAIRPRAEIAIKVGGRVVPSNVIQAVWGFYFLYVFSFCVLGLALTALGYDPVTAFGSVAGTINNMGIGLGETASNFGGLSVTAKWLLILAMLLGRLEVIPLILIFLPEFRR